MKTVLIIIFFACLFIQAQSMPDSAVVKIENKISLFEEQLNFNQERLKELQRELDERQKLNERLTGAILAGKEILRELAGSEGTEVGGESE